MQKKHARENLVFQRGVSQDAAYEQGKGTIVDINSVEDVERIDFPPQLASLTLSTGVHSQWELTSELQWASLARFAHIPSIALHGFRVRGRPEPDLEHVRFLTNEREQNSIWRPF